MGIVQYVYKNYASGRQGGKSAIREFHHKLIASPRVVRLLFGTRVLPIDNKVSYFDLTTLLLKRVLKERLRRAPAARMLEIGVGSYAVLSGCVSRFAKHPIDAVDNDMQRIESSKRHVELNELSVNVFQSDLFSNVPAQTYDIIFWNLPYYRDPDVYLRGLFEQASDFMTPSSELIIGFNTTPLPHDRVERLIAESPKLEILETRRWSWNLHEVLIIGVSGAASDKKLTQRR